MTVIYNNILAVNALPVPHILTGCENQILFRANNWGATPTTVLVESYSVNDPTMKSFTETQVNNNMDWCIPCVSVGEVYRFSVNTPDTATTELFVEILEGGCCCSSTPTECFEIPVKLTPCA